MEQKANFDFSSLLELLADMKRSFWTLDRSNERFQSALSQAHSNFYNKLIPEKRRQNNLDDFIDRSGLGSRA